MPPPEKTTVDAGFAAESLDNPIKGAVDRLGKTVADIERIRGTLEPHLDKVRERLTSLLTGDAPIADAALLGNAERLIDWLEKYARVSLNLAKVVDETARLRSFVAGGADSRPDFSSMSDSDLAAYARRLIGEAKGPGKGAA